MRLVRCSYMHLCLEFLFHIWRERNLNATMLHLDTILSRSRDGEHRDFWLSLNLVQKLDFAFDCKTEIFFLAPFQASSYQFALENW